MSDLENNPLIKALDEKRKAAAEAAAAIPKVVTIKGEAWVPPAKTKRQRKPSVSVLTVEAVAEAMELAKTGELQGVAILAPRKGGGFFVSVQLPPHKQGPAPAAVPFFAAIALLTDRLNDVLMFGSEAIDEADDLLALDDEGDE